MGFQLNQGNNVYIALDPDTRAESDTLFAALSAGGKVEQSMQEMFWGDLHGQLDDPFGHRWNVSHHLRDVPYDEVVAAAARVFS